MPNLIAQCLANSTVNMSAGNQIRDFCYIDDVVHAVFLALENSSAVGNLYNIASGKPISIKEVALKVQRNIGCGQINFGTHSLRKGENSELYADIGRANKELGWEPRTNFLDGIEKTIAFYRTLIQ